MKTILKAIVHAVALLLVLPFALLERVAKALAGRYSAAGYQAAVTADVSDEHSGYSPLNISRLTVVNDPQAGLSSSRARLLTVRDTVGSKQARDHMIPLKPW